METSKIRIADLVNSKIAEVEPSEVEILNGGAELIYHGQDYCFYSSNDNDAFVAYKDIDSMSNEELWSKLMRLFEAKM